MGRTIRELSSGIGACAVLLAFLAGVPVCLVKLVGNPLPDGVPAWSSVVAVVESGSIPPGVLARVLAIVVWIWWSQIAISFLASVAAARRGRAMRPLPLRALGMQPLVVRLVALVVTAAGAVGALAQPALAATPSFAEIAVPMVGGESTQGADPETAPILSPPSLPPAPTRSLADPLSGAFARTSFTLPAFGMTGIPDGASESPVASQPPATPATTAPLETAQPPTAPLETAQPPTAELETAQTETASPAIVQPVPPVWVVVQPGDSLWLLAERHLGDPLRWEDIYELNSGPLPGGGTLRDPNLIHPGWRLRLPRPDSAASAGLRVIGP